MKHTMKRILVIMLTLLLVGSVMLPAAFAEDKIVSNGSTSIYAGTRSQLYVTRNGIRQSASSYRWSSSNKKVVSVSSSGVITGQKAGSAYVYATRKSNSRERCSILVSVRRNKVDYINYTPSVYSVSYRSWKPVLKSVEIVSPKKVVVEYYIVCNFPSSWWPTRINYFTGGISAYNRSTGYRYSSIVSGKCTSITTPRQYRGGSVQTVKATYTGYLVDNTNLILSNYRIAGSINGNLRYAYRY